MLLKSTNHFPVSKFGRALLATTCLTVASGAAAIAGTITEGTAPAPADFPGISPGYLLPVGTTVVNGNLGGGDDEDYVEFQGLLGNSSFSLFGYGGVEAGTSLLLYGSEGNQISTTRSHGAGNSQIAEGGGQTFTGTVPADGEIIAEIANVYPSSYSLTLTADLGSSTPEPATLPLTGLALAGALAWNRRRKA
jgi:hypothetical protein